MATPRCQATTSRGMPCKGAAMRGSRFCGPHHDTASAPVTAVVLVNLDFYEQSYFGAPPVSGA